MARGFPPALRCLAKISQGGTVSPAGCFGGQANPTPGTDDREAYVLDWGEVDKITIGKWFKRRLS